MSFWRLYFKAHKQEKSKARELFLQGYCASDAAANLGVSLRNVQRWFLAFRQEGSEQAPTEVFELTTVSIPLGKDELLIKSEDMTDEWYSFARALQKNHFQTTYEIRRKIQLILDRELNNVDSNFKQINNLSLALIRHLEYEKNVTMLDILNINCAAKRLNADGYVVYDPSVKIDS